jgi:hypothetical protein
MIKKVFTSLPAVCILCFLVLEGLSSTLIFGGKLVRQSKSSRAFAYHTQYDKDLGWVNIANYYKKDFYDPGIYVKTNSKGFRSDKEFDTQVPAGKLRIVCLGDSMTFGAGVDNDHTWCEQLASLDPRLETVNMGEAGYGVDQMYLWYLRDGVELNHNVQIFAFIGDDFRRMRLTNANGYEKPVLKMETGKLVAHNIPVPRVSGLRRWIMENPDLIFQLRLVQLMQAAMETVLPSSKQPTEMQRLVVAKMIDTLLMINKQKGSVLVLLYLPIKNEYAREESSQPWRSIVREEASQRGVPFIDLVDELQKVPKQAMEALFIPRGSQYYASTAGHYSENGNEFVARELYSRLTNVPEIAQELSSLPAIETSHLDERRLARSTK